jgi:PTH1 family peptidyl-tRNA hydrolase
LKAVFGLGNPGIEYALTRHNVGFSVIDLYRKAHCHGEKGRISCSSLVYQTENLLLIKPMTYMNASGEAVSAIIDRFKVALPDVLIIYDDLDLPLGRMRILPKGGAGTQKGMLSILEVLLRRRRCTIGSRVSRWRSLRSLRKKQRSGATAMWVPNTFSLLS